MRPSQLALSLMLVLAFPSLALAGVPSLGLPPALPAANEAAGGPDPRIAAALAKLPAHGLVIGGGYDPDGPTGHGFHSCGEEIALVFLNPDLRVQSDGFVHASGFFFIQFQAIGEKALEIAKFQFSFGKPIPEAARTCDTPEWITGAYLRGYRADDDPRDGFFVPINTTNVPDGEWAAAVSAFDATGKELTRYYVSALVENGCPVGYREPSCATNTVMNDKVVPWPIVLPGDGEQTNQIGGLTVEFAEPLRAREDGTPDVEVYVNKVLQNLNPFEVPLRDDDAIPDNPAAPSAVQTRRWGPGFQVNAVLRNNDIIRVVAYDLNGNRAEKILHIGDSTIGGRISLQPAEIIVIGDGMDKAAVNGSAVYPLQVKNIGKGSAHGNLVIETPPEKLRASFDSDHVTIGEGETHFANLTVIALEGLAPGSYEVKGYATYKNRDVEEKKTFTVKFRLEESSAITQDEFTEKAKAGELPAPPPPTQGTDDLEETPPAKRGLPAPGAAVAMGALALAGALWTRRPRGPARP